MGIDGLFPLLDSRCKALSTKPPALVKFDCLIKDLTGTWHRACLPAKARPAWCYAWPIKRVPWPTAGSKSKPSVPRIPDPLRDLESLPSGCPTDPEEYNRYKSFQITIEQKQLIDPEDEYSRFPAGFFPIEFFQMVWRIVEEASEKESHVVLVSDDSRVECKIKQEERARRVASAHKRVRVTQVPDYRQVTRLFDMEMVEDEKFLRHALLDPEGIHRCKKMRALLFGYLNDCFRQATLPKGVRVTTILEGQ